MKLVFLQRTAVFLFAILLFYVPFSCKKSSPNNNNNNPPTGKRGTGLSGKDNPASVPKAVNLAALAGASAPLPSKVDLSAFCPPVGDQGQTQTCVGWSTGYYAKTVSEAVALNYNQGQTNAANQQLSPKDLFLEIPDDQKGADCQSGTQISSAMDQLVANGVATMATVPWDPSITNCSQSQLQPSWNTDAANHKIAYYRTVTASVDAIKQQLAANIPVVMGIKVSNEFENYTGGVITTATFPNQVGLHAQCIIGYDDNQGPSGAFHVVNSWGTQWGENGYYWID
ncbi:MAG: C1 family peptidase, partial [Bacteroidetes bacterium]|nr:C1 family peptidase [Bacteroidota bacterium]